ncbi:MAG: AraC family transcriptional regulator [Deltaproteobacteria bacterium]|jgi:AraC-like DNA-binding protein|nr:AraC family transcriptional regulator [Deltaproteobacteria bacterium]
MNRRPALEAQDPLGEALHGLRVEGSFYCRSELSAPWGLTMPPMPGCLWFHAVTSGGGTLIGPGGELRLSSGDFVLVPHGQGHRLQSQGRVKAPIVTELPHDEWSSHYAVLRHGGGGPLTKALCGVVRLEAAAAEALAVALPEVLHLRASYTGHSSWMESTLRLLAAELDAWRPGGEAVLTRLADILVIQAIRGWLEENAGARAGWLLAFRDPQLGRVMKQVHQRPEHPWTVAELARTAAMSRSAFAAHFKGVVGQAPLEYLTEHRMRAALPLLRRRELTLAEIGARLGYRSEAAFNRAFKRTRGVTPGQARA